MRDLCPLRAPNLASRVLLGEAIVMNPADSSLFNLNETATAIWLAADGRTTLRQIVERDICGDFEVDIEEAISDAEGLLSDLSRHGILLMVPKPAETGI
jgi:hypothetical protein